MIFNNVTNSLRKWCDEMTRIYSAEYEAERSTACQSFRFLSYLVTAELSYKLASMTDLDYPSFDAYRSAVLDLIPIHMDFSLKRELGRVESYYVHRAEAAFREYLDTVSPDCISPDVPYYRVILGAEADAIGEQFYRVWKYDTSYWYPLKEMPGEDKLYIAPQRIEPYWDKIYPLLGLHRNHIYEYGEAVYDHPHCAEVEELADYAGCETAYCPKDFSWIIYFSHENTVTFAGSILPQVKQILHGEKAHWNCFDWED